MTFKKKLLVAFCVMTVPLAVMGAQALSSVHQQTAATRRLQRSLSRARLFADIESMTYRKVRKIRDYVAGQDPAVKAEFERLDTLSRGKLAEWRAGTLDPIDQSLGQAYEQTDGEIDSLARRAFRLIEDGSAAPAQRLVQEGLNGRLLPILDSIITATYTSSRTREVQHAFDELEATARSTTLFLVVIVAASAIASGIFSIVLSRSLARPVERLKTIVDEVGQGDFDRAQTVDIRGKDELGELARAFVRMAERLKRAQEDLRNQLETLEATQNQLVQSEKLASLGQMAAAVAHGLRNPLASIRAATQLSRHRLPPESPLREHLSAVIDEVDRLEKRIVHLLDFTKPAAHSPTATSLRELVAGVIAVFAEKISKQGVRLRLELDAPLPDAWIDAAQLEQTIIEIVANALEAMPEGGSLSVTARPPAPGPGPGMLELSIEDAGEGIPESALGRVTEPFFTTKADGTGLGLAIAKRFVEENQGRFLISSAPERGTRVSISLPVAAPVAAASP